jgi:hypothetical protein
MFSSGVITSIFMIGSRSTGLHLGMAVRKALFAQISKLKCVGVHVVEGTIVQGHFQAFHGEAGEHTVLQGTSKPFCTGPMNSFGMATTLDLVDELQAGLLRIGLWLDAHVDVGELTATTGLLLVQLAVFHGCP